MKKMILILTVLTSLSTWAGYKNINKVFSQEAVCTIDGEVVAVLYNSYHSDGTVDKSKGMLFLGKEGSNYDRKIFSVKMIKNEEDSKVAVVNFTWMNNDTPVEVNLTAQINIGIGQSFFKESIEVEGKTVEGDPTYMNCDSGL